MEISPDSTRKGGGSDRCPGKAAGVYLTRPIDLLSGRLGGREGSAGSRFVVQHWILYVISGGGGGGKLSFLETREEGKVNYCRKVRDGCVFVNWFPTRSSSFSAVRLLPSIF